MFAQLPDGRLALEQVLSNLGRDGVVFMLGSGDGHYEQRMADIAEQADNLIFLCGYSETLADPLYRAGDLFLMPSLRDSFGFVFLEAMTQGLPCLGCRMNAMPEIIDEGSTGYLVERNDVDGMAAAIASYYQDASNRRRMGQAALDRVRQRYTWPEVGRQISSVMFGDEAEGKPSEG